MESSQETLPAIPPMRELTRYIFNSEHYSEFPEKINYAVFMPSPGDNKTSVFGIDGLSEPEVWDIVQTARFAPKKKANLKARGDISEEEVTSTNLFLEPSPASRHINIAGWPPITERQQQVNFANLLANKARLKIR
jgi:hypothetical protein